MIRFRIGVLALALLTTACATPARQGTSGPVSWELENSVGRSEVTLTMQETAGTAIRFTSLKAAIPLPPTGWGREYHGGMGEQRVNLRLDANSTIAITIRRAGDPAFADYELWGMDDNGRPVVVKLRVPWR